ncbi:hypothetical protein H212_5067 [Klebsiella pneumoniae UHKPC67]|nr:hypothetical protein H212_5067 [Klebsiella pneumoniae UHKPC67]
MRNIRSSYLVSAAAIDHRTANTRSDHKCNVINSVAEIMKITSATVRGTPASRGTRVAPLNNGRCPFSNIKPHLMGDVLPPINQLPIPVRDTRYDAEPMPTIAIARRNIKPAEIRWNSQTRNDTITPMVQAIGIQVSSHDLMLLPVLAPVSAPPAARASSGAAIHNSATSSANPLFLKKVTIYTSTFPLLISISIGTRRHCTYPEETPLGVSGLPMCEVRDLYSTEWSNEPHPNFRPLRQIWGTTALVKSFQLQPPVFFRLRINQLFETATGDRFLSFITSLPFCSALVRNASVLSCENTSPPLSLSPVNASCSPSKVAPFALTGWLSASSFCPSGSNVGIFKSDCLATLITFVTYPFEIPRTCDPVL